MRFCSFLVETQVGRRRRPGAVTPAGIVDLNYSCARIVGAIVPRPIAFVSSLSADGVLNLAPFSFFIAISANPPVVCFSPMIRSGDGRAKNTLRNIAATGEFVVWRLTPVASGLVRPPQVKESRIHMECRTRLIDPDALHAIGSMGGPTYTRTTDRFDMARPR